MASDVARPFFSYNNNFDHFYPDSPFESAGDYRESHIADRRDTITGTGQQFSYYRGQGTLIEVRFSWLNETARDGFWTMWDAVKDGSAFVYHDDDSYYLSGTPTCGDGAICGELQTTSASDRQTPVKMDVLEMPAEELNIYGYWSIAFRMRKVES